MTKPQIQERLKDRQDYLATLTWASKGANERVERIKTKIDAVEAQIAELQKELAA